MPSSITVLVPSGLLASPITYQVSVVNPGPGGGSSTPPLAFAVSGAPIVASTTMNTEASIVPFNCTVAMFSTTDVTEPATSFSATIDWGDSTMSPADGNPVLIMSTSPGDFGVTGLHTYSAPGSYPITVTIDDTYGETAFAESTIQADALSVDFLASATPAGTLQGQPISMSATLTVGPGSPVAPTGSVTFSFGGTTLGSSPLVPGADGFVALLAGIASLPGGVDTIMAAYSGDDNYGPESTTFSYTVHHGRLRQS